MEQRLSLGQAGGVLVVREEELRAVFEAERPDDKRGLYKVHITGASGGNLLLGTLMPENGCLRLRRTLAVSELKQKNCWPVTKGEARLAFSFGKGGSTASGDYPAGWCREDNPARHMGDRVLAQAAGQARDMLFHREEDGFSLAAPFDKGKPFPLPPLLCFAYVKTIGQRLYLIFGFNRHGCPIFQNKGNETGNTDDANQ